MVCPACRPPIFVARPISPVRLVQVACVAFCLAAPALSVQAKVTHSAQKHEAKEQIEDLEQQWRTAVLNLDVNLMDKLLSDDYVGISMNGQVNTKLMQLDRLRTRSLVITRMDLSDMKIKLIGSVAIVTSLALVEGHYEAQDMHGTYRYTRVYQRMSNGVWKITNFEATRVPLTPAERANRPPRATPSQPGTQPTR
jgi:ketosteroid isomerase-like protein